MKRLLILTIAMIPSLAMADLGIMDTPTEIAAKTGASNIGITQIYDHSSQVANGQFYVPITYNGNTGAENDPFHANSDIDYVPLSQLKGTNGTNGSNGAVGSSGANGAKGDQGDKGSKGDAGAKGDKGDPGTQGDDMNHRLMVNVGAEVRWYDWKHFAVSSGYRYDVNHGDHTVDALVLQVKLGKSYEGREMEALKGKLKALEAALSRLQ